MSSAQAGLAAAVTKPGGCERTVLLGKDKHVVKLSWRLVSERGVLVTATLVDSKHKKRRSQTHSGYAKNTEEAVSEKAQELTDKVLKNKREQWQKAQQRSGCGSSSGGARRTADSAVADPVIMALRGGGRTRSRVVTIQPAEPTAPVDWCQQSTETFLASMDSMGYDKALKHLEEIGSTFAKDTRKRLRELEDKVSTAVSLERAIEQARKQRRTKEGSRTLQTILTAAAFPVDGVDEVPSLSAAPRAKALGVCEHTFNSAVERAKNLLPNLHPTEAIKRGVYWFWPRTKQSNAASE